MIAKITAGAIIAAVTAVTRLRAQVRKFAGFFIRQIIFFF